MVQRKHITKTTIWSVFQRHLEEITALEQLLEGLIQEQRKLTECLASKRSIVQTVSGLPWEKVQEAVKPSGNVAVAKNSIQFHVLCAVRYYELENSSSRIDAQSVRIRIDEACAGFLDKYSRNAVSNAMRLLLHKGLLKRRGDSKIMRSQYCLTSRGSQVLTQ
ncbi:MAG TPA: hypothetical protein VLG69_04740 [Candidatus Andersenbacteria bacterium]|nr:hypothetical protein [Candidatus Andersenbacteria bacterium]